MIKSSNHKQYDLEDRTFQFSRDCRAFVRSLPRNIQNIEDGKQLVRSSGSVSANYIEANEALSKKDFAVRIKICKKEAKESRLWLHLIDPIDREICERLSDEATQLMKIFGAILDKVK